MAEKKQHTIVSADSGKEVKAKAPTKAAPAKAAVPAEGNGKAKSLRLIACLLWVVAIAFEVLAVLIYVGKVEITFMPTLYALVGTLVLDLAFVIAGAQFWKKANHMDPASEAQKVKFWLWNNMGVVVCCFAFIPFLIVALTNKDADPKLKKVAIIAALAALLIGGVASYDWNPVSEEGVAQATQTLGDTQVLWTKYGKKYHLDEDCQYLNRSDVLTQGTIAQAVEAGRSTICSACAKNHELEVGENGAVTGTIETVEEVLETVEETAA